jgi:hypothetical protein
VTGLDSIVADLRAGDRLRDVARRHKITEHEIRRIANQHGIRRSVRSGPAKRPERPCAWRGRATTSLVRTCPACARLDVSAPPPGPEHALTGGRWVLRGGVRVWEPAAATEEETAA